MTDSQLLSTKQVADFVANGCLRFEGLVPDDINEAGLEEMRQLSSQRFSPEGISPPDTGTPLSECYPPPSAIGAFLRLPSITGIIESLVGPEPTFDHDWTHHIGGGDLAGQHLHVDAIIDTTDPSFDIQLFWFPHDVAPGEGGTRYVPGSHLNRVHAGVTAAYQHIVGDQQAHGPAGTVYVFHHGLWHAGQPNPTDRSRWMHKTRLNPSVPQVRLWDTSDLADFQNTPSDHIFANTQPGKVGDTLRTWQPWLGVLEQRHEVVQRTKLWRYLTGDTTYDVDHYLTRLDRPLLGTDVVDHA